MFKGITIKITRQIETRLRRPDDRNFRIWMGIAMCAPNWTPHPYKFTYIYDRAPQKVTTEILCPPPGTFPRSALGYPRLLPRLTWANDNRPEMSIRGHHNAHKFIIVDSKFIPPAKAATVTSISRSCNDLKVDFLEEAFLRRLSQQFQRHIFVHDNGRYGYIDETLHFIPIDADGPMEPQRL